MGWGCLADMCTHYTELSWPDALLMTSSGKPITWGGYMQDPGSMLAVIKVVGVPGFMAVCS